MYNQELESLMDTLLEDGVLTDKKKEILLKKAQSYSVDLDEFELVIEARAKQFYIKNGRQSQNGQFSQPPYSNHSRSINTMPSDLNYTDGKDWLTTLLLCIFLGPLGIHRFYVGKTGTAVAMLLMCVFIIPAIASLIWNIVDFVTILTGSFTDSEGNPLKRSN